jgi:hypothetical protein
VGASAFGQPAGASPAFGATPTSAAGTGSTQFSFEDPWSSSLGDVGEDALAAFRAETFDFGGVPLVPPPVALRA